MKSEKLFLPNLGLCIVMDLIGMSSYILPGAAEFTDVVWAPIAGFLFFKMFGKKLGVFGGMFTFLEEIIPFTDLIPSFTIAWYIRKNEIAKELSKKTPVLS